MNHIQFFLEKNEDFDKYVSQLKAENERLKKILHSLTPGGSEFFDDPEYCASFIKDQLTSIPKIILSYKMENEGLSALNKELVDALKELCNAQGNGIEKEIEAYDNAMMTIRRA